MNKDICQHSDCCNECLKGCDNTGDIEDLSREFCELTGITPNLCQGCRITRNDALTNPHITCRHIKNHSDFSDAVEVLRVMEGTGKLKKFLGSITLYWYQPSVDFVLDYILDDTGRMLKEAVEWLRKELNK